MEESGGATLKRPNSTPSAVVLPTNLPLCIPKPQKHQSSPVNGHHHRFYNPLPPSSSVDFELVSFKSSSPIYTSFKDLLPSTTSLLSPTATTTSFATATSSCYAGNCSGYDEISIRNRLVKQAAWAYLQPMSSSPSSSGRPLFSTAFHRPLFVTVKQWIVRTVACVYDWLIDALWLLLCR